MDAELAQANQVASRPAQAVLGVIEFRVSASVNVSRACVRRQLVIRRHYKLEDPLGGCASPAERKLYKVPGTVIHVNPIDIYRDFEG